MEVAQINRSSYQEPLVPQTEKKQQQVQQREDLVARKKPQTTRIDKYV